MYLCNHRHLTTLYVYCQASIPLAEPVKTKTTSWHPICCIIKSVNWNVDKNWVCCGLSDWNKKHLMDADETLHMCTTHTMHGLSRRLWTEQPVVCTHCSWVCIDESIRVFHGCVVVLVENVLPRRVLFRFLLHCVSRCEHNCWLLSSLAQMLCLTSFRSNFSWYV